MTYDADRDSSSTGAIIAATVVLALVLVGGLIVVGGGAFLYLQSAEAQKQAVMAREQAQVAEQLARMEAELAREGELAGPGDGADEPVAQEPPRTEIELKLGADGTVELDGDAIGLAELQRRLLESAEADSTAIVLAVDHRCLFQHVADVMSVCQQVGISDIRVTGLEQAGKVAPAERE